MNPKNNFNSRSQHSNVDFYILLETELMNHNAIV